MGSRSGRWFEHRMSSERKSEAAISAIAEKLKSHSNIRAEVKSEQRVEQMRRDRLRRLRDNETKQAAMIEHKTRQEHEAAVLDQQQASLVAELQRRKSVASSENAKTRRLCEQSEELRALSEKLHAAQMNKDQRQQIENNVQRKRENFQKEVALAARLEQEKIQADKWGVERAAGRCLQLGNLKEDLDKQIEYRQREKEHAYEEFLREKQQVDDVVNKVLQQEKQVELEKAKKRADLRETLHKYEVERRTAKYRLKQHEMAELAQIQEWAKFQNERLERAAEKKSQHQMREAAKYDRVAAGLDQARKDQEETEQLLIELFIAEADKRVEEEARKREERQRMLKDELVRAHQEQQTNLEKKIRAHNEHEKVLRVQMMAKFAEDDRIEQMNSERARRAKINHHHSVQRMLDERRALFEAERQEELRERERETQEEQERLQIVERERERMLREYARKLKEYLPRGVILSEKDHHIVFDDQEKMQDLEGH